MKRISLIALLALTCAGIVWAGYQASTPPTPLSKYVPAGPLLYLEAKDFSSLLADWNSSPQKRQWVQSSSYEIFSRSRLFLRLKGAGDQFAAAAGLPPDMDFLAQVAGGRSALALYDIGKLQFLYITYLPSAKSMETTLWQSRAKFEPRAAGGVNFYVRRDPESEREVAFAVAGDFLLLATREDLMAGALQLMSGPGRAVENEDWWKQSTAAATNAGDLRMALDLEKLVPNGYFRTYWVQQNITALSQYSAAVSDLFRSDKEYREERVLIRKKDTDVSGAAAGFAAAADLVRLVPDDAGVFDATANPTPDAAFALLETKLLAPHLGPAPASHIAPQVQLTSGEQGAGSDLETRIDQPLSDNSKPAQSPSELQDLLAKTTLLASLQIQSTSRDQAGVFVRTHSAVVLAGATDWDEAAVQSALSDFVRPSLTASQLGVSWQPKPEYQQLDGLWPLAASVHGKYLLVADDPSLMESLLANLNHAPSQQPAQFIAGFNHRRERANLTRFTHLIDHPGAATADSQYQQAQPKFFSGNMASLSTTLAAVSSEKIEVRDEGGKVRQSVAYEWSQ